jgi:Mg2+/Co2+ transporter CorB
MLVSTAVSRGRRHQLEKVGHTFEVMRRQRNQIKALRIVPPGVTAKPSPLPRATA